jgi:hypothetical protein
MAANRFQQQSLQRKLIYIGLILVFFIGSLFFRKYYVEPQAKELGVREESLGEVELTDKALRLTLTGSRGFAVCGLWAAAIEKQRKHEWNETELLVRSLIKLQPHFVTPWLFQSWNLAYNVSVECDRVKDKYFYVTRGIQLLAEGDRQNKDNPDMRFFVGMYTQNKMGISDEANTMRCLFQMSCIDPKDRDPASLRTMSGNQSTINWERYEEFCLRHPQLVRRLRDHLRCKTPDDVIDFLTANQKIPGRFEEKADVARDSENKASQPKSVAERFPALPPQSQYDPNELTYDSDLDDSIDNYAVGRAWFGYSQDPLATEGDRPGKRPRFMNQKIFEGYPARGQAYVPERMEKEGWFDTEGWEIKDWFPDPRSKSAAARRTLVVGNEHHWAEDAWARAHAMYERHGREHGLLKPDKEVDAMPQAEREQYEYTRMLTNFPHFYFKTKVEARPEVVTARKLFFKAEQLRRAGERDKALKTYQDPRALSAWIKILLANIEFSLDDDIQEESYMMQRRYMNLLRYKLDGDKERPNMKDLKTLLVYQDILALRSIPAFQMWLPIHLVPAVNVLIAYPFDIKDRYGRKLISDRVVQRAIETNNVPPDLPPVMTAGPLAKPAAKAPLKPPGKN